MQKKLYAFFIIALITFFFGKSSEVIAEGLQGTGDNFGSVWSSDGSGGYKGNR